jgi:hypothetical protein
MESVDIIPRVKRAPQRALSRLDSWVFTNPAGFTGTDSFTYTINDGRGAPVTGTVTVNVKDDGPAMNLTIFYQGNGSFPADSTASRAVRVPSSYAGHRAFHLADAD